VRRERREEEAKKESGTDHLGFRQQENTHRTNESAQSYCATSAARVRRGGGRRCSGGFHIDERKNFLQSVVELKKQLKEGKERRERMDKMGKEEKREEKRMRECKRQRP
jgi:hypothetical protein